MNDQSQLTKKHKTIRALENKAKKGDISALYQLAKYYTLGQYVEIDTELADVYYQQMLGIFQSQSLKIFSVKLLNFRVFDGIKMRCDNNHNPNLTVIIGNNGAGKTTLLDSIVISLSWLTKRITTNGGSGQLIQLSDIKNNESEYSSIITKFSIAKNIRYEIELSKAVDGSNSSRKNNLRDIGLLADIYKFANFKDDQFNFPIMAFYSVKRAVDIDGGDINAFDDIADQRKWSKFDGYSKALNGTADFKLFFRWFKYLEDDDNAEERFNADTRSSIEKLKAELEGDLFKEMEKDSKLHDFLISFKKERIEEIKNLEAKVHEGSKLQSSSFINCVKKAINDFMPEFSNIRIQRSPILDMLIDKNGMTLSVLQLSQGEKSLLALISDIARRLVLLNPSLDDPLKGNGVVLIDELDLHLHPKWQQTIVPNLVNTFPNIQFIVTTHSPEVVTTVNDKCIRILNNGEIFNAPKGSKGAKSSRMLERLFGVDARPPDESNTKDLKTYKELVYNDQWGGAEAQELRRKLNEEFGDGEPDLLELDLYIENRIWEIDIEKNQ